MDITKRSLQYLYAESGNNNKIYGIASILLCALYFPYENRIDKTLFIEIITKETVQQFPRQTTSHKERNTSCKPGKNNNIFLGFFESGALLCYALK